MVELLETLGHLRRRSRGSSLYMHVDESRESLSRRKKKQTEQDILLTLWVCEIRTGGGGVSVLGFFFCTAVEQAFGDP